MNSQTNAVSKETREIPEGQILKAIREIRFGNVEIIVHESRVTEIRQTRRLRAFGGEFLTVSTDPAPGGFESEGRIA